MSGGQIVALLCSILLLLPGGCFLWVGIFGVWRDDPGPSLPLLSVASVTLVLVALLYMSA